MAGVLQRATTPALLDSLVAVDGALGGFLKDSDAGATGLAVLAAANVAAARTAMTLTPGTDIACFKILSATRDLTAGSGDVAYTGTGFTPRALLCLGCVGGTTQAVFGMADGATAGANIQQIVGGNASAHLSLCLFDQGSNNYQHGVVKTYDADGFTLTWTKSGTPTGTATLYFLCLR